ncbi:MAG: NYN domain-containing protein [Bacteroidota bacterium]
MIDRVTFLVGGFNLYHSLRNADRDLGGATTRWLDLVALCESFLYVFRTQQQRAELEEVHYVSALARHLEATNPNVTARHRRYLDCLRETGVQVHFNRFKKKTSRCAVCNTKNKHYEEKETDVALAAKLLELLIRDACDTVVLVTGDTDLAPAVRAAQSLFPQKRVAFAFPYKRKNKELAKLAPDSFVIGAKQYVRHQLADPFQLANGTQLAKPPTW